MTIHWNPDLDNSMRTLRKDGNSLLDCSLMMGISYNVLRRRAKELGVNKRMRDIANAKLKGTLGLRSR